ncbi:hypothetical protein SAMN02799630_04857 [Paenibacillus sp. UNCCL117]|uniref:hypothetical protein n=1 Tax=unclassified Paenibacillus TaxID=185978 RepID=UPI000881255F|nr:MULTISPECIES: hypothetical protein [unclassified Paenibacillus]SDE15974.1 hypothetical protein SAMN04488602_12075 [Paenibacillus sp. cl123]SFW61038.1 hypothetical protein SAMN02799630_04857 [Paenibacillus sp. UNCCL117]
MKGTAVPSEKNEMRDASKSLSFGEKTEILKRYEAFSYQIAHYLLQEERAAQSAAEGALLELYRSEEFFRLTAIQKGEYVRKVSMKHALLVRRQADTSRMRA